MHILSKFDISIARKYMSASCIVTQPTLSSDSSDDEFL